MATEGATVTALKECAGEVFRELGPGHSEATYQNAFEIECQLRHWVYTRQPTLPIWYKSQVVGYHRPDLQLKQLIIEFKVCRADTSPSPSWSSQLEQYLRGCPGYRGLLVIFTREGVNCIEFPPSVAASLPTTPKRKLVTREEPSSPLHIPEGQRPVSFISFE